MTIDEMQKEITRLRQLALARDREIALLRKEIVSLRCPDTPTPPMGSDSIAYQKVLEPQTDIKTKTSAVSKRFTEIDNHGQ